MRCEDFERRHGYLKHANNWEYGEFAGSKMNQSAHLHHVGFVVPSISDGVEGFRKCMGADWDREIFHDHLQKAKVTFLRTPCPSDALIELVEPAGEGSPVLQFLKK